MATNLDVLTDKIYREGVEKARHEADEILKKAREEARQITEQAKANSKAMLEDAQKEADGMMKNAVADIRMAGNQAISALKQEIKNLLSRQIIEKPVGELFSDPAFLKAVILEVVKNTAEGSHDVKIPARLKNKIDQSFENALKKEVKELKITFDDKLHGGFRLGKNGEDYSLTFSDEDFAAYFKSFLRNKAEEVLFGNRK